MRESRSSAVLGGSLGGALGGLLGIGLGGWIAYAMVSSAVELPEPGAPGLPLLVLLQVYVAALGVPVLLGATAGGVVGSAGGSLTGYVVFPKLHATPDVTAEDADRESPEVKLAWVNGAIYGLVALGLFWVAISALMLTSGKHRAEGIAFMLWAWVGVASGIMLSKRVRAGRVLGVVFVLPGLLAVPVGTAVASTLLYALCCGETTRYLSRSASRRDSSSGATSAPTPRTGFRSPTGVRSRSEPGAAADGGLHRDS